MKCVEFRIVHTDETLHPVHQFEIEHDEFHGSELLHWNPTLSETNSLIFRVRGDPDAYNEILESRDDTLSYTIAPIGENVFYCGVRERLTERDQLYVDAFVDQTAVVVPPICYNQDGTIDVTLVGSISAVEGVLSGLPDDIQVNIRTITDYRRHVPGEFDMLTARQRKAIEAAVNCGYYRSPREGQISDVADVLDIANSTAAEHLRKAEAKVMEQVSRSTLIGEG